MGGQRLIRGARVRELRELLGIEQGALARAAGHSKQHQSDIENDKSDASRAVAEALAQALATAFVDPSAVYRAITNANTDGGAA